MKMEVTILAKSDKHTGYCVGAITKNGDIVRLVRDEEGHALNEEQCKFEKMDSLLIDVTHAPLKHQRENYILNEVIEKHKSHITINDLTRFLTNPRFIFSNENPWLTEEEMQGRKSTLLLVEVDDLQIYQNDEDKFKADFTYNNQAYKKFSITDPKFKTRERKIPKAIVLISLPDTPYTRYGHELYYKFISAVYPIKDTEKSFVFDCYRI